MVELITHRSKSSVGIHRTSVYRQSKGQTESSENIMLMHEMDMLYTAHPYFGYRRMTAKLREKGFDVNHKRVRRLMRLMGIQAIYPKPNLSKRLHAKYCRPYLLRGWKITHPNHGGEWISPTFVWDGALCTCLPLSTGSAAK